MGSIGNYIQEEQSYGLALLLGRGNRIGTKVSTACVRQDCAPNCLVIMGRDFALQPGATTGYVLCSSATV